MTRTIKILKQDKYLFTPNNNNDNIFKIYNGVIGVKNV